MLSSVPYLSWPIHFDTFLFVSCTACKIRESDFSSEFSPSPSLRRKQTTVPILSFWASTVNSLHMPYRMNDHHQLSCTLLANTPATLITNRQHQLSCIVVNKGTAPQTDLLKNLAENFWFVLGAYFFAFFPWTIMSNFDFISEKWRKCRRTRTLARWHLAALILPIIYVVVYTEAQRRSNDYKEFAAALVALMFNVFQLLRTIMGIAQLNAFVAWCKDATECMRGLLSQDDELSEVDRYWKTRTEKQLIWSRAENSKRRSSQETSKFCGLMRFEISGMLYKLLHGYFCRSTENNERKSGTDEEDIKPPEYEPMNNERDDENIEDIIEVNNMVVDNELGGREITVRPSWKKIWNGLRKGSLTPSRWLRTDRVMLNTVRWCGAYLCGMGDHWGGENFTEGSGEILEKFFSDEMCLMRRVLQFVEWNIELKNNGHRIMNIYELASQGPTYLAELSGEMSTAYGTGLDSYVVDTTFNVSLYSFEFNSLIGSYPTNDKKPNSRNRESVRVGLAHSVILAKHLGVEKLKAIREYYNHYRVPLGSIRKNAFRVLYEQMNNGKPDAKIETMFESIRSTIPLFPFRMQALALWEEGTNWRVLQASAHQDIWNTLACFKSIRIKSDENVLRNLAHKVNIFDYCARWSRTHINSKGSRGVILETVRTFLAKWIAGSGREPVWEADFPNDIFEYSLGENSELFEEKNEGYLMYPQRRLIWVFQRELQRKVAEIAKKDENLPANAALITLFLLGFPLLSIVRVQDAEVNAQSSPQREQEESTVYSVNRHSNVDVSVQLWRAWTILAPQQISLIFRVDLSKCKASLKLENDSSETQFRWQDWVDAAMGYMKGLEKERNGELIYLKGFEEDKKSQLGYGRRIVRPDLLKPLVDMCPLRVDESAIEPVLEKTSTVRVWTGWSAFDVQICKFEFDQLFAASYVNVKGGWTSEREVERVEELIEAMKPKESKHMKELKED